MPKLFSKESVAGCVQENLLLLWDHQVQERVLCSTFYQVISKFYLNILVTLQLLVTSHCECTILFVTKGNLLNKTRYS